MHSPAVCTALPSGTTRRRHDDTIPPNPAPDQPLGPMPGSCSDADAAYFALKDRFWLLAFADDSPVAQPSPSSLPSRSRFRRVTARRGLGTSMAMLYRVRIRFVGRVGEQEKARKGGPIRCRAACCLWQIRRKTAFPAIPTKESSPDSRNSSKSKRSRPGPERISR